MKKVALLLVFVASVVLAQTPAPAPPPRLPDASRGLEVKYVRDSAEYATLSRQVYRQATEAALRNVAKRARGSWGVILDVDETTLDNSVYQLERATYGLSYEQQSWGAWISRAEAGTVPGVGGFLDAVRSAGGRVAFITDRAAEWTATNGMKVDSVAPTKANLVHNHLFADGDLLCLKTGREDTKAVRRKSVATGEGPCSWAGLKIEVVAFMGDQMGDFPQSGEAFDGAGTDAQFGLSFFLLPNPQYGNWVNGVTRELGAFK